MIVYFLVCLFFASCTGLDGLDVLPVNPASSVKTLKETQSTLPNQWSDLVHSLSITRLQTEETLLPLCRLSDANTRILLGY